MQQLVSLIVPMHNEAPVLPEFFDRIREVMGEMNYEILCIDDGSTDSTWNMLVAEEKNDSRVRLLKFSRNFGKEAALTAGLDFAAGDVVIPIDADLQDPPELIPEMIEKWQQGYQVVLATRKTRDEPWLKRRSAEVFYKAIGRMSNVDIPQNTGDFRLIDRQVVESIKYMPERTRFMKGILAWPGFKTTTLYFDRPERAAGQTSWSFWRLWLFALDGIFSFTTLPIKIWSYIGGAISLLSFLFGIYLIITTLIFGAEVPGYTSIMVVMLFLGGIQLLSLGIMGEYLARIYRETKQRPIYIIAEQRGFEEEV